MKNEVQAQYRWPKALAIYRDTDDQWHCDISFAEYPTDDELAALHDFLRAHNKHTPTPIADSSEAGRGDAERTDYKALFEMHESALIELWSLLGANGQHDAVTKLRALSAPVGEPYAYAKQIGSDIVRTHSLKHMMPEARAEYTIPLYTHPPAPAVGPDVREVVAYQVVGEFASPDYPSANITPYKNVANLWRSAGAEVRELYALTRPLGGFVQGSIARKQSTDTEGSSRTETAGGAG